MNESELLEMGMNLKSKYENLMKEKKDFENKCNAMKRSLMLIYIFSRELDEIVEEESTYPLIVKYMIERIRGTASQMILPDMEDEEQFNFDMFLFN